MRATIRDTAAIGAVSPPNLVGYLRAHGWTRYSDNNGVFSVWHHAQHPEAEAVVPLRRESGDFLNRLSDILTELEAAEGRSQIDILRDILASGFDIVRLAAKDPDTNNGTIRIEEGVALFEEAREMLMAAACATVKPRPVFHSRKPQRAIEYLREARLGQTEHGSFVLTILSPVAPQITTYGEADLFPEEPFERRVIRTLTDALDKTVWAASAAATGPEPNFEPFQAAVEHGVSANLCEAIAGLFKLGHPTSISVSTAWALNRPEPSASTSDGRTLITRDIVPTINEAARLFRAWDTLDGYCIKGFVVKLERSSGQNEGRATVLGQVEGVMRKVMIALPGPDYDRAVEAHRTYKPIRVIGNVYKRGKYFQLHDPRAFDIVPDDDDDS